MIVAAGKQVTQAQVTARVGDETIIVTNGVLGDRDGWPAHQWRTTPPMLTPDRCVEQAIWPMQGGGLLDRFEVRLEPGAVAALRSDGTVSESGRLFFWLRPRDAIAIDAAMLALVADFVPAGVAVALGRSGGGNSLDNSLRLGSIVPTSWLLCDVTVDVSTRGFGYGDIRIFSEDGRLMAMGAQTLALRFVSD